MPSNLRGRVLKLEQDHFKALETATSMLFRELIRAGELPRIILICFELAGRPLPEYIRRMNLEAGQAEFLARAEKRRAELVRELLLTPVSAWPPADPGLGQEFTGTYTDRVLEFCSTPEAPAKLRDSVERRRTWENRKWQSRS